MNKVEEISVEAVQNQITYLDSQTAAIDLVEVESLFSWSEEEACIIDFDVRPQFRNQGIGTVTLRAIIDELRTVPDQPPQLTITLPMGDDEYGGVTEYVLEKCGFDLSYEVSTEGYPERMVRGTRALNSGEVDIDTHLIEYSSS